MRSMLAWGSLAAALALGSGAAQAVVTVYDTAEFVQVGPGSISLDGFGRGVSLASVLTAPGSSAAATELFFDTWNIRVGSVTPGQYSFTDMVVDAVGELRFQSLVLTSYDAAGDRQSVLFDINADQTQAVGSGSLTILATCPVASCVWIDVIGTQPVGSTGGYGGSTVAVVPEPAVWSVMLLGLGGLGWAVRRRRGVAAPV
jgi:hypothetical protein